MLVAVPHQEQLLAVELEAVYHALLVVYEASDRWPFPSRHPRSPGAPSSSGLQREVRHGAAFLLGIVEETQHVGADGSGDGLGGLHNEVRERTEHAVVGLQVDGHANERVLHQRVVLPEVVNGELDVVIFDERGSLVVILHLVIAEEAVELL